ncbi:MAG: ThiF family adenylyltransferase [Candidatus Rariloculaceae bacterium]
MNDDLYRYNRQTLLPNFGEEGQRKLLDSTVLILGCGALGSMAADLLARAGVGHLKIADRDFTDLTNLQRQVLFDEHDVSDFIPKAEAAKRRIAQINSCVRVTAIVDDLNYRNIEQYSNNVDVLVDGLDNFETRYLANDLAVKYSIPYTYGAAVGTVGTVFTILPHTTEGNAPWETCSDKSYATPCFRCLFEEAPPPGTSPTCDTVGILAPVVTTIASFQVAEILKVLTSSYAQVNPTLLNVDLWENTVAQLRVGETYDQSDCPCCKHHRFDYLDGTLGSGTVTLCGHDAVQLKHKQSSITLNFDEIATRLREHGEVLTGPYMLRAKINDNGKNYQLSLFPDGRAIIHGTTKANVARSVYAKYVGT